MKIRKGAGKKRENKEDRRCITTLPKDDRKKLKPEAFTGNGKNFLQRLVVLVICIAAVCISMPSVLAVEQISTQTSIQINQDLTYDVVYAYTWNLKEIRKYSEKNWNKAISNNLTDVAVRDDFGSIPINKVVRRAGNTLYYFDLRFKSKLSGKDTYTFYISSSSKNRKVAKFNAGTYHLVAPTSSFYNPGVKEEDSEFIVRYPGWLTPLSYDPQGLLEVKDKKGTLNLRYANYNGNLPVGFFDNRLKNNLTKIKVGSNTFILENAQDIINAFNEAIKYRNVITDYPDRGLNIVIVGADIKKSLGENHTEGGVYYADDFIIINTVNNRSVLSYADSILHELTHFSVEKNYEEVNEIYPKWAVEGLARYTEIKVLDTVFKEYKGLDPFEDQKYFHIKPSEDNLTVWYEGKQIDSEDFNKNTEQNFYGIYGFIINYYIKTYGEAALQNAIQDTQKEFSLREIEEKKFLNTTGVESIFVKNLISSSKMPITAEDIYFPEKRIFLKDRKEFLRQVYNFTAHPFSAEKFVEEKKLPGLGELKKSEQISAAQKIKDNWGLILFMVLIWGLVVRQAIKVRRYAAKSGNTKKGKVSKEVKGKGTGSRHILGYILLFVYFMFAIIMTLVSLGMILIDSTTAVHSVNEVCIGKGAYAYKQLSCISDQSCQSAVYDNWYVPKEESGNKTYTPFQIELNKERIRKTIYCGENNLCGSRSLRYINSTQTCDSVKEYPSNITIMYEP